MPHSGRELWDAFWEHVHLPLAWSGPRLPNAADDVWDVTTSVRSDEWLIVELQRRIALYTSGGEFSDEAIASCMLRYANDERWAGVDRLAIDGPTATTATSAQVDESRRSAEATAAFEMLSSAPVVKVSVALYDGTHSWSTPGGDFRLAVAGPADEDRCLERARPRPDSTSPAIPSP